MTFRTRLLLVSSLTITGAVALVTGAVSLGIRHTFDAIDSSRRDAALARFRKELAAQGDDVVARVKRVAASDVVLRLAVEANRAEPDFAPYVNEAQPLAESFGLEFLDLVDAEGRTITSAHFPARFGYPHGWTLSTNDMAYSSSFLTRIPGQEAPALALAAVHSVSAEA